MEPLFETTSILTKEQYDDYTLVAQKSLYIYNWFSYMVGGVFLLGMLLLFGDAVSKKLLICPVIILLVGFSAYIRERNAEKLWQNNPAIHDLKSEYQFFDTEFTQKNQFSQLTYSYQEIKKIITNENYIFLMTSKSQGVVLEKSRCSDELVEFIHQKTQK